MDRRKVTIGIIAVCLLIVAAVLSYFAVQKKEKTNTNTPTNINAATNTVIVSNTNTARELTEEEKARNEVTRIATIFAERYGTYTNVFDSSDVQSVASFVTDSYLKTLQQAAINANASGTTEITAQVLNAEVNSITVASSAVVTVSTLRSQSNANTNANVVKQDLSVRFVKVDSDWKVDGSTWGKAEATTTL